MIEPLDTVTASSKTEAVIQVGLQYAGCTFPELAEQARTGQWESMHARMVWAAIGMYYQDQKQ